MAYWENPLERAREQLSIYDVWRLMGLEGSSQENPTDSPWAPHGSPSFSIYEGGKRFNDFSTGEKGDVIDFIAKVRHLSLSDAARELIRMASSGPSLPFTPPKRKELEKQVRPLQAVKIRGIRKAFKADLERVARLRKLPFEGVGETYERGLLQFANILCNSGLQGWRWHECFLISDSTRYSVQARRLDGKPFYFVNSQGKTRVSKARLLAGSAGSWPIGIRETDDHNRIYLVEGGPDLIATISWMGMEGIECGGCCCLPGVNHAIHSEALPYFKGKTCQLLMHHDFEKKGHIAGEEACRRWEKQLSEAGATLKPSFFPDVKGHDINDYVSNLFQHTESAIQRIK